MKMTENRRIFLNIAATYLRSFYTLALGLVTARWLLMSLGEVDYGLFGLVGGLVAFVTLINRIFANAVGRFYAVAIGKGRRKGMAGESLLECRRWFTSAVSIHTVVPLLLVAVGWPVGEYATSHWLVIPADRIASCAWVWRLACISAFVGMVNVPFRAMYTAKQEIAELTFLSIASATLNALLLYYMVSHPGDWLARYAFWHCLLAILPMVIICVRAIVVYPECRLRRDCLWNPADLRRLAAFAGWNAFSMAGTVIKSKGFMVVVNVAFGPAANAAMAVANRLAAKATTFASSIVSSFTPAIATSYGAGKSDRVKALAFLVGKVSGLVVGLVSVPLFLEVDEVMHIWLKTPPVDSAYLCSCVLVTFFLDKFSIGQRSAIAASGKIALVRFLNGLFNILAVPTACALVFSGFGIRSIGWTMLGATFLNVTARVVIAERVVGIEVRRWIMVTALPLLAMIAIGLAIGSMPRLFVHGPEARLFAAVVASEAVMLPFAWFVVISRQERAYVVEKTSKALRKFMGRSK